jgi:hypothetical protein
MNRALRAESAASTLARLDTSRMLMRLINTAYTNRYASISATIKLSTLGQMVEIDGECIAELKVDSELWMLFNAFAGTKMFDGQLKELVQSSMNIEEVKRGNAFIDIYRRATASTSSASTADIIVFAKTMFDVCIGMATVLVQEEMLLSTADFEAQLTLKAGRENDTNDVDAKNILTFLQTSCIDTTPRTWFASAYPHFIKNPLLLVQTLLTKTPAFIAYMPGCLGDSCAEISAYIINSMLVIDKSITTTRYMIQNSTGDSTQVFIRRLALFIFKTAALGGFSTSSAADVREIHQSIQAVVDGDKLKETMLTYNATTKKRLSPATAAGIDQKYADILARVKAMDRIYALPSGPSGPTGPSAAAAATAATAHMMELSLEEIESDVQALIAMIESAPRKNFEKIELASRYNRVAVEDGLLLDVALSNRAATLAATESVKAICDAQVASLTAVVAKCAKTVEAAEKGDAAAKQKEDGAKADKSDAEKKIKKLTESAKAMSKQIDALNKQQDADTKRKELSIKTISHNAAVIAGGSAKAMVWPAAAVGTA